MLKEKTIQTLIYEHAIPELELVLKPQGFKYLKSKGYFVKQSGIFQHIIHVSHPTSSLDYDESRDLAIVKFTISGAIKIPDFEKWCFEKFNEQQWYSYDTQIVASTIDLEIDELYDSLGEDSFYTPTPSRELKKKVALYYIGSSENYSKVSINELLNNKIPSILSELVEMSDLIKLSQTQEYPTSLSHILLLVFGSYTALAKEYFDKGYYAYINLIENNLKKDPGYVTHSIKNFEKFIKIAQKVTDTNYSNPYGKTIEIIPNHNEFYKFSEKTIFKESLRIDISQLNINSHHIDSDGAILLIVDERKIIKLASDGTVLIEKEVGTIEEFATFYPLRWYFIAETNEFCVNNCIIRKDNSILTLRLPQIAQSNSKKRRHPHIADFKYLAETKEYLVLYQSNLLSYEESGVLKKSVYINQEYCSKIIMDKQWIVAHIDESESVALYDFNGKLIQNYECHSILFANDFIHSICFVKNQTQYYSLINGKKTMLRGHPTHIKGYNEIIFEGTWRDTSIKQIKFSPDNRYIVAGAGQGKYVAWTLPKLERRELLPKVEYIDLLPGTVKTIIFENVAKEVIDKPQLVNIEGQVFLKNTKNDVSDIFFLEDGDLFLLVINNYLTPFSLLWDRNFNNLAHYKMNGKVALHGHKYLSEKSIKELIVYFKDKL